MTFLWNHYPLQTSSFITWILSTTTKICTNVRFSYIHIQTFHANITYAYTCMYTKHTWPGFGPQVSTVNFRRIRIMMVGCYTILSEWQLPRPSPICLYSDTAFNLMTCEFGTLTERQVESSSPILLTKISPLSFLFCCRVQLCNVDKITYLKFESGSRR